jgi:hypothetical protein
MKFIVLLILSIAAAVLRFHFGKVAPSAFGSYEALAHVLVGALIMEAIQFGRPLCSNPFLGILTGITLIEIGAAILA